MTNLVPRSVWTNPIHFLAFGLGSGAAPVAPGTFGTLAGMIIYLFLPTMDPFVYAIGIVIAAVLGVWLCGKTSSDLGVHDHGGIVWDEFVGYWITMFMAPTGIQWVLIGFVLFRLFDIIKPWPIKWIDQKVHGGLGIMLDDVIAGILAALCLQAVVFALA